MKRTLVLLFFLFLFLQAFSQREWSNWYFGSDNLLTFKNGFPELVHGFVQRPAQYDAFSYYDVGLAYRESISYSDPSTGDMRFLVCAGFAFGPDYQAFPAIRSQRLRACSEDVNAYHIVPFHNNPDKFYIIQFQDCVGDLLAQQTGLQVRCPNSFGLAYSIVDMRMNGGLGDLSAINQQITGNLSAQMTTVKHANGNDVWVIVHPYNSDIFSARLVSDNGIGPAVKTNIGPMVSGSYANHAGTLTASRDGRTLAGYSAASQSLQLMDFDNTTGQLSNYRTLPFKEYVTSMQFSPDDSKLYYCGYGSLYQYDLSQPDIGSTLTKIASNAGNMRSLQLASDGKIYVGSINIPVGNSSNDYIGIIQCPNLPQYACNFDPQGFAASGLNSMTLINDLVKDPKAPLVTKFSLGNDTTLCSGSLILNAPAGWQNYKWSTGETTQRITVTEPGLYHVLTGNTGFNCPAGYGYINISAKSSQLDLGPDSNICKGSSYQIHIDNSFYNIQWENGSSARDSIITTPNIYRITATGKDGCPSTDSIRIVVNDAAHAMFGNDTALCNGSTLTLHLLPDRVSSSNAKYHWQDGSQQDSYQVKKSGDYWGTVSVGGCIASDTIHIVYNDVLSASLGNDTSFCIGDSAVLKTPISNASYLWNTGSTAQQISVKASGTYSVKVDNGTCFFYDTVYVSALKRPVFSLGNDTVICSNQNLVLSPALSNGNWLWQDGSTSEQFHVQLPGLYWLQFTQQGCSERDSVQIAYKKTPLPKLGADTSLCEGHSLLLDLAIPDIGRYEWQDGTTGSSYLVSKTGKYQVKVFGLNGCSNSDSINVTYTALPAIEIIGDSVLCAGTSITLTGKVRNANNFVWQTATIAPQLTVTTAGTYSITAANVCGTVTVKKTVNQSVCSLILPSAFTPNNDWINDIFRIKYPFETRNFVLIIYNRWGEKIFQSNDIKKGWDGNFRGQIQPAGNYFWFITLTDMDNHLQQAHGSVLLIR